MLSGRAVEASMSALPCNQHLFHLLLRARGDHGRALHSWREALRLGPFCNEVQLFLLMSFVKRLARLEEGWNDEEVRAVGLRQELLLHPVANGARETDDSVVELEHTWLRHHKETLIPRQFISLPVHKPHDLEEVGLVVLVDHAELIRSVPHATLVLVLVVGMIFPLLDLLHKLDHLSVDGGGLSILRHQPVQWRDRLRLHAILTSSGQSHLFRVFPHGHSTILNLQLPLANVVHKLVSWILETQRSRAQKEPGWRPGRKGCGESKWGGGGHNLTETTTAGGQLLVLHHMGEPYMFTRVHSEKDL